MLLDQKRVFSPLKAAGSFHRRNSSFPLNRYPLLLCYYGRPNAGGIVGHLDVELLGNPPCTRKNVDNLLCVYRERDRVIRTMWLFFDYRRSAAFAVLYIYTRMHTSIVDSDHYYVQCVSRELVSCTSVFSIFQLLHPV